MIIVTTFIKLDIPEKSRIDSIWNINISGLSPKEEIAISATMQDQYNHTWTSSAIYESDSEGVINLNNDAPISGSYSGIDPMGLIWSMQCKGVHGLLARRSDLSGAKITIQVKNKTGQLLIEKTVVRYLVEPEVSITPIRENGIVGTLYQPAIKNRHDKRPALIVLSGSEGGFRHEQAALLASEGYVTLALAYFIFNQTGYDDLPEEFPKEIKNIPLEYFESAINFLQKRSEVDPNKIGVIGTSRGGELSLLLGSLFPQIKCVIAYVPNHAIQAAFGPSNHEMDETEPSWTYRNKPFLCFPLKVGRVNWFSGSAVILKNGFLAISNEKDLIAEGASVNALIPVENINGPVLLISAGDDLMWPSKTMSELIMKRLKEKEHQYYDQSQHICYEEAGHLIMTPWWPTTGRHAIHPVDLVDYDFGGTPQADAHAGYHSWGRIKKFLSEQLPLNSLGIKVKYPSSYGK